MCEELRLERYDNSPWGFRLTGGLDFGTPLGIIKVTGGSIAELCGVQAGDLVKSINGKPTKHFTHLDAQKCIAASGNYLTLTVMRGSIITPPATPLCGRTPVPEYMDELNHYSPSPTIMKSDIENEIMGYYRNATDMNDGLRSPAIVRQKTGQNATITNHQYSVNDEGQLLLGDRALTDFEIAELLTSNEEVLDEGVLGINFKKFLPKVDFIRNSEVFKLLQNENTKKEISEQAQLQKEPTKRFSTFLMKPKAPSEEPKGPSFVRFKPPRYLPKQPEKKWELPKLKPWERPKKEEPAHSVLWLFMEEKGEEVIDERWGTDEEERLNMSRNSYIEYEHSEISSSVRDQDETCSIMSRDLDSRLSKHDESISKEDHKEDHVSTEENLVSNEVNEKKQLIKGKFKIEAQIESVDYNVVEETKTTDYNREQMATESRMTSETTDTKKLVQQLAEIKSQIEALENEAPSDLQTQLLEVKKQLSKIVQIKTSKQETSEMKEEQQRKTFETCDGQKYERNKRTVSVDEVAMHHLFDPEERGSVEQEETVKKNQELMSTIHEAEVHESTSSTTQEIHESLSSTTHQVHESSSSTTHEVQESVTETAEYSEITNEKHLEVSTYQVEELEETEYQLCIAPQRTQKPKKKPTSHPITPQLRPIVLPGGRMWRKPKDAEHEDFYQGVLVAQAEVLIGTNDGVNFTKYVPPKVDMSTSEVYRLIHETEDTPKRLVQAETEAEYCQPISKRHFYAATLREPAPIGMVELSDLQDT